MGCSFAYSHRNVFGRNKKLNLSLERGQIDSIFRLNFTDPWIDGDNKRTSRTVMVQVFTFTMASLSSSAIQHHAYVYSYFLYQNSRTPGTLVHGGDHPDHGPITIGRVTAGLEYSRPFRPKWSGTLGLIFQVNILLLMLLGLTIPYGVDLLCLHSMLALVMIKGIPPSGISITAN